MMRRGESDTMYVFLLNYPFGWCMYFFSLGPTRNMYGKMNSPVRTGTTFHGLISFGFASRHFKSEG